MPFSTRLLHKKFVAGLLLGFILCLLISQFIPQRTFLSIEEQLAWQNAWPLLASTAQFFGFDHLLTTRGFFLLICLVLFVLLLSLGRQWRKIRVIERENSNVRMIGQSDSLALTERALKKMGYRFICLKNSSRCYLKDRMGLWGSAVLHLGVALIMVWGMINAVFYHMGTAELYEGECSNSLSVWRIYQRGVLAPETHLPDFRLEAVLQEFYDSGQLKAHRSIISAGQGASPSTIAINEPLAWQGWRLYQGSGFGHTFFLSITDQRDASMDRLAIQLDHPKRNGVFVQQFTEIKTKFGPVTAAYGLSEADGAGDLSLPVLTLKIPGAARGQRKVATLRRGQKMHLGTLTLQLDTVKKWTTFHAVKLYLLPLLFFGFALVVVGCYLLYCRAPRQMMLTKQDDKVLLKWQAFRFRALYRDEPAAILAGIAAEGSQTTIDKAIREPQERV